MKKDETRFTIRFNPVDPRQQKAMNALEAAGRRKASFIADAVCEYLTRHGGVDEVFPISLAPASVAPSIPCNAVSRDDTPSPILEVYVDKSDADSGDNPYDSDMCQAILNGLNAFSI
jgi:hypothetical protein